jgi:DNA-directed RNA polymerase I, II, and III subunit RPABC2
MFGENDEIENDFGENYLSEEEDEIGDPLNIDDEDNQDSGFKILTYKNVIENIQNKPKKTIPYLTKFERARITGVRLQQLAYGAKPRVDTTGLHTINQIVEKELIQRKIPFILRRTLPNGVYEDWKMEEFQEV